MIKVNLDISKNENKGLTYKELYDLMTKEIEIYKEYKEGTDLENLMNSKIQINNYDNNQALLSSKCLDLIGFMADGKFTIITSQFEDILDSNKEGD